MRRPPPENPKGRPCSTCGSLICTGIVLQQWQFGPVGSRAMVEYYLCGACAITINSQLISIAKKKTRL